MPSSTDLRALADPFVRRSRSARLVMGSCSGREVMVLVRSCFSPCRTKPYEGTCTGHHSLVGEYRARAASPPPVLSPPRPSVTSPPPPLPLITSESTLPARRPLPTPPVRSPDPAETQLPPPTVPAKPIVPPKPTFVGAATRTPFGAAGRTSLGGGGDVCPRCKTTVYAAESVLASGSK